MSRMLIKSSLLGSVCSILFAPFSVPRVWTPLTALYFLTFHFLAGSLSALLLNKYGKAASFLIFLAFSLLLKMPLIMGILFTNYLLYSISAVVSIGFIVLILWSAWLLLYVHLLKNFPKPLTRF